MPPTKALNRRRFLGLALSLSLLQACRQDRRPNKGSAELLLAELDERVASAVKASLLDSREHLRLLVRFLHSASFNTDLDGRKPLLVLNDRQGFEWGVITPDIQLTIVQNRQYRFLQVRGGLEIVVVISAISSAVPQSVANYIFALVSINLPKFDHLLISYYPDEWLNIQLFSDASFHSTRGSNIAFVNPSELTDQIVVHELAHTFNSRWPDIPLFIIEGFAELVSFELTGAKTLQRNSNSGKAHLAKVRREISEISNEYLEESQVGADLFIELRNEIGSAAIFDGIVEAYRQEKVTGLSILTAIKRQAPDRARIEEMYVAWIADYIPQSAS